MTLVGGAGQVWATIFVIVASTAGCGGAASTSQTSTTAATRTSPASPPSPAAALVDLDLVDVPIEDALAQIAHQARVGLSVSSDVSGITVTLRVRAMPWDDALALIAKQHGLRIDRTNVMLVVSKHASPSTDTFTGAPIEVSFEGTPIREVARVFSAHAKITIRVDDDVEVAVTQRLRNVPWDFALDHIARKYDLRVSRVGDALRIAR